MEAVSLSVEGDQGQLELLRSSLQKLPCILCAGKLTNWVQNQLFCSVLEKNTQKAMVPHSSTLAWKIPWMEEPGRLQSMGSLRVGHD